MIPPNSKMRACCEIRARSIRGEPLLDLLKEPFRCEQVKPAPQLGGEGVVVQIADGGRRGEGFGDGGAGLTGGAAGVLGGRKGVPAGDGLAAGGGGGLRRGGQ